MLSTEASYNGTDDLGYGNAEYNNSLDPRRDSLYVVIPVTVIYTFIFVTGAIGNVVTCIVIARNKYMHTATNYYLFSLAISDLLLLVTGLPQEMVSIWIQYPYMFGEPFCVLRGLAAETSGNATVLTITAFTVERYIAICYPFLSHTMSKLSRAIKFIVMIWIVSLAFAAPHAAQIGVVWLNGDAEQASCTVVRHIFDHSFEISTFLFFVVPMTIITVLYALIGLKLRSASVMKRGSGSFSKTYEEEHMHSRRHRLTPQSSGRVINMLELCQPSQPRQHLMIYELTAAVVVAFFICWAPFHAQRLVAIYGQDLDRAVMYPIYHAVTYISGIFYYLSATINPILYNIMSLKFREAFKETMARCCGITTLKSSRREQCYSVLSRSQHHRSSLVGQSQSTENSNHSVRDESYTSHLLRETCPQLSRLSSSRGKTTSESDESHCETTLSNSRVSNDTPNHCRGGGSAGASQQRRNFTLRKNRSNINRHRFSIMLHLRPPSASQQRRRRRISDFNLWSVLRCVPSRRNRKLRARYYIEAASPYEMTIYGQPALFRCSLGHPSSSISNSSLRVCDDPALGDELSFYMRSVIEEVRV